MICIPSPCPPRLVHYGPADRPWAIESSRPDRLVDGPLAAAFVQAVRTPVPMILRWPADGAAVSETDAVLVRSSAYVGVRSRFFDDYLSAGPGAWLEGHGWRVTDEPAACAARRYGRDLADPRLGRLPGKPMRFAEYSAYLAAQHAGE